MSFYDNVDHFGWFVVRDVGDGWNWNCMNEFSNHEDDNKNIISHEQTDGVQ